MGVYCIEYSCQSAWHHQLGWERAQKNSKFFLFPHSARPQFTLYTHNFCQFCRQTCYLSHHVFKISEGLTEFKLSASECGHVCLCSSLTPIQRFSERSRTDQCFKTASVSKIFTVETPKRTKFFTKSLGHRWSVFCSDRSYRFVTGSLNARPVQRQKIALFLTFLSASAWRTPTHQRWGLEFATRTRVALKSHTQRLQTWLELVLKRLQTRLGLVFWDSWTIMFSLFFWHINIEETLKRLTSLISFPPFCHGNKCIT